MKSTTISALVALFVSQGFAANVVHLPIVRGDSPLGLTRRNGIWERATIQETLGNNFTAGSYLAKVSVGSPGQNVQIVIDTGSSDVFVVSLTADQCTSAALQQQDGGCIGGTFDPTKSSTFNDIIPGGFSIQYQDQSGSSGDYFTDTFSIGGTSISTFQMGLALNLTTGVGIMGIGYRTGESLNPVDQYPTLVETLVSQKKINRKVYSLYLDDLAASTGSILFGGIDTQKFIGDLKVVPVEKDSESGVSQIDSFIVSMTSLTLTASGKTVSMSGSDNLFNLPVILDSGTTITYVPSTIFTNIVTSLNGVDDSQSSGIVFVDCNLQTSGTYLTFGFGGSGGPTVNVPVSELLRPLGGRVSGLPFSSACSLGIKSSSGPYLLGDTFLRSAYVVYDLDNNQIGIAQTNFDATGSNIVEVDSTGTSLPSATGASSGNTQGATAAASATGTSQAPGIPTGLGGGGGGVESSTSPNSATAAASSTKKSAAGTVPPFNTNALVVLCVSMVFVAAGGIGFLI